MVTWTDSRDLKLVSDLDPHCSLVATSRQSSRRNCAPPQDAHGTFHFVSVRKMRYTTLRPTAPLMESSEALCRISASSAWAATASRSAGRKVSSATPSFRRCQTDLSSPCVEEVNHDFRPQLQPRRCLGRTLELASVEIGSSTAFDRSKRLSASDDFPLDRDSGAMPRGGPLCRK